MSFNQPRYRSQPPSRPPAQPWHRRTVTIVLFLIFFFPVGLILLWQRPDWSVRRRGLVTAVIGVIVLFAAISPSKPPATTTVLTPTAIGATTTPSQASSSSPAASPSPAVTTTSAPAPATSAPPKTTAAAPVQTYVATVHTSAAPAPVHTTEAPQPVQTTAQQQSCYPLTNGGNCYKPGEFCRSSDHGKSGIDAEGNPIKCEDNDGWRWEPA